MTDVDDPPSSYKPVDLSGDYVAPTPPEFLARADGVRLFYAARLHWISAEPESAKSWLALWAVAQAVEEGRRALWIDYEKTEGVFRERMGLLGVDVQGAAASGLLAYVRPVEPLGLAEGRVNVAATELVDMGWDLVIMDGVTDSLALEGIGVNDNDGVALWAQDWLRRFRDSGAAVVAIDHATKSKENRGRFAIGAQHKLGAVDGSSFTMYARKKIGRPVNGQTVRGEYVVKLAKDSPGYLNGHTDSGDRVGVLYMEASGDGGRLWVNLQPADGEGDMGALQEKIAGYIHSTIAPDTDDVKQFAGVKAAATTLALADMVDNGWVDVERGGQTGRRKLYSLTPSGVARFGLGSDPTNEPF